MAETTWVNIGLGRDLRTDHYETFQDFYRFIYTINGEDFSIDYYPDKYPGEDIVISPEDVYVVSKSQRRTAVTRDARKIIQEVLKNETP
ncbi:hypothetical protein ATL39_0912 [Sinobaca qinghaiensis]|uniref:Uncharacterized protein n=1 Tax=Sinobaca qinghaiensis TaxID=342944 RepID=A0A419V5F3_9BACL|nr:hypothetical protein [Sinobaca qinghaiensis]RKD75214.1 hypothetical protein ATL39_0912 [Sinobaca qinghaiensis]